MTLAERVQSPTPKIFKAIRSGGLFLATIGATLLSVPAPLPPLWIKIAGYLTVAGTVATAVSQATTTGDATAKNTNGNQSL